MAELYDLLGLPQQASRDDIRTAITAQRRTWRRRTSSAQIEIRQEAERRMQQLDEAERTLLDEQQRREYDSYLDFALSAPEPQTQAPEDAEDKWVVRALEQLGRDQHGAAVFTARRAVEEDPENSYAWSILAEASAKSGDLPAAVDAIERALRLEPEDPRLHLQRGAILSESGDSEKALHAYRAAASLDPTRPEYHASVVEHLAEHGDADHAITEAERAYQTHPDDGVLRTALARALLRRAELAQHELPDGTLVISEKTQAQYIESLCNRGLSVQAPDEELNDELAQQRGYAQRSLKRRFSFSALKRNYRWPIGLGLLAMAGVCCIPGTAQSGDPSTKALVILVELALVGGFAASIVLKCCEPRYVRNAVQIEHSVPRRSAQLPDSDLGTGVSAGSQSSRGSRSKLRTR